MLHVIVNREAQSKKSSKIWPTAERVLAGSRIPYRIHVTACKGDASVISREISETDPAPSIAVIGGDGTIHEVLSGLSSLSAVTLGVIPQGSGNDFARGMGLLKDPGEAIKAILEPKEIVPMDIGCLKSREGARRFGVSTGIGFDAAVCHEVDRSGLKTLLNRFGAGKLTYSIVAAKEITGSDPGTMRVRVDGEKCYSFPKAYFAAVMNQPYEGGGLMLCPSASACDGLLDLFVCADIPRTELVTALPFTMYGLHRRHAGVHFMRGRHFEIFAEQKSRIHLDGEAGELTHTMDVSLEKEKLRVIVR